MNDTVTNALETSQARDVWLAFERLYPAVAAVEQPAEFAKKLVDAYVTILASAPDKPQPSCK